MKFTFILILLLSLKLFAANSVVEVSSVYPVLESSESRRVHGTALIFNYLNESYLLTASHVVDGTAAEIILDRSVLTIGQPILVNRVTDVALFKLDKFIPTPFLLNSRTLTIEAPYKAFESEKMKSLAIDREHFVPYSYVQGQPKAYLSPSQELLALQSSSENPNKAVRETFNGLELRAYAGIRPGMSGAPLLKLDKASKKVIVAGVSTSYSNFFQLSYFSKVQNVLSYFFPEMNQSIDLDAKWFLSKSGFVRHFSNGYIENRRSSERAGSTLVFKKIGSNPKLPDQLQGQPKLSNSEFKQDPTGRINPQISNEKYLGHEKNKFETDKKNFQMEGGVRSDGGTTDIMSEALPEPEPTFYAKLGAKKYQRDQFSEFLFDPEKKEIAPEEDPGRNWRRNWTELGFIKNGRTVIGFNVRFHNKYKMAIAANENSLIFLALHKSKIHSYEEIYDDDDLYPISYRRWKLSPDPKSAQEYKDKNQSYCTSFAMNLAESSFDVTAQLLLKKEGYYWHSFPMMVSGDLSDKYSREYSIVYKGFSNGKYTGDDYDLTGLFFTDLSLFNHGESLENMNRMYLYVSSKTAGSAGGQGVVFCQTDKR